MACLSVPALSLATCGGNLGGVELVYMLAYKDFTSYAEDVDGVITGITMVSGQTFVNIGQLKDQPGNDSEFTSDPSKAVSFWTNNFSFVLPDMTKENIKFVNTVSNQPVCILYKTRNAKWYLVGSNGSMWMSAGTASSGKAAADGNSMSLTFSGTDSSSGRLVDDSAAAAAIA